MNIHHSATTSRSTRLSEPPAHNPEHPLQYLAPLSPPANGETSQLVGRSLVDSRLLQADRLAIGVSQYTYLTPAGHQQP